MQLEDEGRDLETPFETEVESVFNQYYMGSLNEPPPFVRLESEDFFRQFIPVLILSCRNAQT